ncbi:hypothetical protein ES703_25263 [subsurface metagenome]|nr:hypothetical protein [bacterium]TET23436.1 MAG: hypothetical protein E3J71_02340 [Candidatus Stahlbacteria bacterium]
MEYDSDRGFFHSLNQVEDIWLLAELYYGDASLWWVIYHANLDRFGDDPEYTAPGLEVFIPYLEVSEQQGKVPGFLAQVALDPSYDPMVLLAANRYADPTLCFDLYEHNRWDTDHVPIAGDSVGYFARASKPNMRRAQRWREIFYRGQ